MSKCKVVTARFRETDWTHLTYLKTYKVALFSDSVKFLDDDGFLKKWALVSFKSAFEIVDYKEEKEEVSYNLKLQHIDLLDTSEIRRLLTREKPLIIMERDDGYASVLTHDSIRRKVSLVSEDLQNKFWAVSKEIAKYGDWYDPWIPLSSGLIKKYKDVVKEIKDASVTEEYKKPVDISIESLTI